MVKKYNLIKIALMLIYTSCIVHKDVPKYISEEFSYCYDGKDTNIDSLLNIDGYYVISTPFKDISYKSMKDSSYFNIMFYNNGICVFNFFPLDDKGSVIDNKYIPLFFRTIINEKEDKKSYHFYNSFKWGRYIIEGDTIKAQVIYRPKARESTSIWGINEVWYKIIDRNTINEIPLKLVTKSTNSDLKHYKFKSNNQLYSPAKFVSVKERPTSECWLMKEKWFWCNENDFINWKKNSEY